MRLETGIYKSNYPEQADGWRILCEQEKTPFRLTDRPDCTVLLCEGHTPEWLTDYLEEGGVAVLSGVRPEDLPFLTDYIGPASLESADLTELGAGKTRIQSLVQVYDGAGVGMLCLHEKRKIKGGRHPDEYPAVLWQEAGKGGCWYTGIPFSELVCALGDTLRQTPEDSDYSERITAVDKHLLLRAMRRLLAQAYAKRGLPYIYLHYYPEDYRSVFVFRVDVDGVYGDCLEQISAAAKEAGIRVSFYINQALCQEESSRLRAIDSVHDIGCHAREHNLFTTEPENYSNIHDCRVWLKGLGLPLGTGFVAPRGMWNFALNRALWREGISYTSDFGYCVYDLPFYPYEHGRRMEVKQIPVDPFSAERAYAKAKEEMVSLPDEYISERFRKAVRRQYALGMPVILYSHPQCFGRLAGKVFVQLAEELEGKNIWRATMEEFHSWWTGRDHVEYSAFWSEAAGIVVDGILPEKVRVKVVRGGEIGDADGGIKVEGKAQP